MTQARLIISGSAVGAENMSIDESIFESTLLDNSLLAVIPASHGLGIQSKPYPSGVTLRFYTWSVRCATIGYFQPYINLPAAQTIRRITGGLTVEHKNDISYCFCANKSTWPFVYDQETNYQKLHLALKTGLELSGYKTEFANPSCKTTQANMCVEKYFAYDLLLNGKKALGSCQRRRGDCLIVQGSLHLPENYNAQDVISNLVLGFKSELNFSFEKSELKSSEIEVASKLKTNKYLLDSWNKKY